jgi:hypothetical protein
MTLLQIILLILGCFVSLFLTLLSLEVMQDTERTLIKCLSGAAFWVLVTIDAVLIIYGFGRFLYFLCEL